MKIKGIVHKLLKTFLQIIRNKYGLIILLTFIILESGMLAFIFYYNSISIRGLLALMLFIALSILILEWMLYLLIKYKITFLRFSSFLNFLYKKKAMKGFPYSEIFPDTHYYIYHPFYNFAPKPSSELKLDNIEINSFGFRGEEKNWKNSTNYYIYLSGSCEFFDGHLKLSDTFAHMLEAKIRKSSEKEIVVLNAGCLHYTLLHSLNRFIIDLNRIRFHLVILYAGVNDVLVFVHAKNGKVSPDYTNLYKPFTDKLIADEFQSPFVRYSKILQLYKYLQKRRMLSFDNSVEAITPEYNTNEHIEGARQIFTTTYFENYLRTYIGICKTFQMPIMLATANYNPSDMKGPARAFVAYGIDQMNLITKSLADEYNLPIFDYQKEFIPSPGRIFNKWHYTGEGNKLRAELVSNFVLQNFSL